MALILIIDDDDQIRDVIRRMLEPAGHEVVEAVDGADGIRIYRERPADLIITDLIMPKKEGVELIMELKMEFPDVKINFEKVNIEGDFCLLQWSAEASNITVPRGTTFFLIQDGLIQRQGEWFEIIPKEG